MPLMSPQHYVAEYVPEEDVMQTLPDGRVLIVAAKGVPMPKTRALELGLIKLEEPKAAPEPKSEKPAPSSNKAKKGPGETK